MASLYNLEPQPTAKVILKTTAGDISLELFGKQTPLATRNFLQHCLDGYYTNTIFHRVIPGFIIQGGDPTGTGSGGISAINDGDPFQDEFHSRLKFNRRGLLGMANEGKDSNGSQFFLTLGTTAELQGKNTMFGRIEGDTIYNLMKMADVELADGTERPIYPTRITGAEVLVNPFEDMAVRAKEAPRTKGEDQNRKEAKKRKKPAGKNVLSFGGDDGEEAPAAPVLKKAKVNPKMLSTGTEDLDKHSQAEIPRSVKQSSAKVERRQKSSSPAPIAASAPIIRQRPQAPTPVSKSDGDEDESEDEDEETDVQDARRQKVLDKTNAEIESLKASMKRTVASAPKQREKPKSALEAMIPVTSTRGRKRGKATDEKGALDMFNAFKQRLEDVPDNHAELVPKDSTREDRSNGTRSGGPDPDGATNEPDDEEAELCDLHFIANCQSCRAWDEEKPDTEAEVDGDDDPGWMSHKLTFAKDVLGKDLEWKRKMEEIEVIDPREKSRSIVKAEKRKGKTEKNKR